jgi:N-acetylglucosamine kinase-like BadF-type ATPase
MTVIALDIGGSGSRIVAADGHRAASPGPALSSGDHPAVVAALAEALPSGLRADAVVVSAASLISQGDPGAIEHAVRNLWDARTVVLVSDAVAGVVGAWGESGGAVVAAGTGAVGFGTDLAQVWVRSDGWGHDLGDEGGAAWIGRAGLRAAARSLDGRPGGSPRLVDAVRARFGDPATLPALLRTATNPATVMGTFAPEVSTAADAGDDVAVGILTAAADRLAETGLSVLQSGVPERLALVGGVAQQPLIAERFAAVVREQRPDVEVATGARVGAPLDGALRLARIAAERTLSSHSPYLIVSTHPVPVQGAS